MKLSSELVKRITELATLSCGAVCIRLDDDLAMRLLVKRRYPSLATSGR